MPADTRIVYGARCTWWDSIDKVGTIPGTHRLPCCPYCQSPLFEVEDEATWNKMVEDTAPTRWPGYVEFMAWLRGKCIHGGMLSAKSMWEAEGAKNA